ncbi:hypothetical protein AB1P65_09450 [Roseibium alexandrii]
MSPSLLILTVDVNGCENCWLVDEWKESSNGERDLFRAGRYIITLGPDDFANGWDPHPWPGVEEIAGDEIDLEVDEDGEAIVSMLIPTIH